MKDGSVLGLAVASVAAVAIGVEVWRRSTRHAELENRGKRRLHVREEARREFERWVQSNPERVPSPARRDEIARWSAKQVVDNIRNRSSSCVEVMVSMCLRAKAIGEEFSCNADEMFLEAIEEALKADDKLVRSPLECGELHGLPISIKDQIDVKGTDSTAGMLSRSFEPMSQDAAIVQCLREQGAIPYVKTNVPQLLMIPESCNRLWGRSLNPWPGARGRSPGGSSGGEGTLIAAFGSFLGIGTDIGGSIRIPCHYCGLAGFKPTPDRISSVGISAPAIQRKSGQQVIKTCAGPMARNVGDLVLMMKVWLSKGSSMYTRDQLLAPVHFGQSVGSEKPSVKRVGYFVHDGWFECSKACARAVEEARQALQAAGYELVPFKVPDPWEFVRLYINVISADGKMRNMRSDLRGEKLLPEYGFMYNVSRMPFLVRTFLTKLHSFLGNIRLAHVLQAGKSKDAYGYWNVVRDVKTYRSLFLSKMDEAEIDAILCPGGTLPAFQHGMGANIGLAASTTFLFNLLHLPAGTVPITQVGKEEESELLSAPDQVHAQDELTLRAKRVLSDSAGLPIGVQVVARPWQDEYALEIMQVIEDRIRFDQEPAFFKEGV